jgi:hypothetical protein
MDPIYSIGQMFVLMLIADIKTFLVKVLADMTAINCLLHKN